MYIDDYPKHLAGTKREWKAMKRREICALLNSKTLDDLRCGCAYTPAYEEIDKAINLLRQAQQKMTVKEWGR